MNTTALFILSLINLFSELVQLTYEVGSMTRKYVVPALVYTYCVLDYYVKPALTIPYYYVKVREARLCAT